MKRKQHKKHSFRFIKAYHTTLHILLSFGWILILSRFFGKNWRERKMDDAYLRNARRLKNMILELRGLYNE